MSSGLITLVVVVVTVALFVGGFLLILPRLNRQHRGRNASFRYARNLWDPEVQSPATHAGDRPGADPGAKIPEEEPGGQTAAHAVNPRPRP